MTRQDFNEALEEMMFGDFGIIHGLSTYDEVYERWEDFVAFCKQFKPQARAYFREHGTLSGLVYI